MVQESGYDPPADVGASIDRYNQAPQDELFGLSPDELAQLYRGDWRTVGAVRLRPDLDSARLAGVWAFDAALDLLRLIHENRVAPTTAGGNLNRKFMALVLERLTFEPAYLEDLRRYHKVIDEPDVGPVFDLRMALVAAGYLQRRNGFRVTPLGRRTLEQVATEPGPAFQRLFLARMGIHQPFLDEVGLEFQSPLGPALCLLGRGAGEWVDVPEITSRLLLPWLVPHETLVQLHMLASWWVLNPCVEFGLLARREEPPPRWRSEVRLTPLFSDFVKFAFEGGPSRRGLRLIR